MKILIVGGGFGGVRAALLLANKPGFEVQLMVTQPYFEYHAALYRSATGRSPLEVTIPLQDFFKYAKNVEVVDESANHLNAESKTLTSQSGAAYHYDKLILALGNITEYYGIKGLREYAYGVKTIHEALKLKRHLHEELLDEQGEKNYVVVGAGATGVELSAELPAYLKQIRKKHKIDTDFTVSLVEAGPRPTAAMPEKYSAAIEKRLRKLGVNVQMNTSVLGESVDSVVLSTGSLDSETVIWTAGVVNNPFFTSQPEVFKLAKVGRVEVDEYLQAAEDVYVIGDAAATKYSGMAQTALFDANFVVQNIFRQQSGKNMTSYQPKQPIYAIPVGPRWAMVLWGKIQLSGRLGWAVRRLADLRLYLTFLPLRKAITTWRYGFESQEVCEICQQ